MLRQAQHERKSHMISIRHRSPWACRRANGGFGQQPLHYSQVSCIKRLAIPNADCGMRNAEWIKERSKELLGYGLIKSSEEVARGSVWKFFYPFRDIRLNRMRWRIMKGMFLETITTCASAKSHFINVSLVDWKTFAHLQAAFIVNATKSLSRQHGANKNEGTTSSALMAFSFS